MSIIVAQVSLEPVSHLTRDRSINTFHWDVPNPSTFDYGQIVAGLDDFYGAISGWYSLAVNGTGHTVKFYDLSDPEPRQPVATLGLATTFTPTSSTSLPAEVAACASFAAAEPSGIEPKRRKGRVYLGPLGGDVSVAGRLVSGFMSDVIDAMTALWGTPVDTGNGWVVYSRTDDLEANPGSPSASSSFGYPVIRGWCDDAFDTQRRRGIDPTTRSSVIFS